MPKFQIRRTYPCGMQESVTIEGWSVSAKVFEDEKPKPCPLHQWECWPGAGR